MNYPRETIFQAQFNLIASAKIGSSPAFATTSRKFRQWSEVPTSMQPAFYQQEGNQKAQQSQNFGETLWSLKSFAWVYNQHDPSDLIVPSTAINNLIDAVENVLLPDPSGRQTLGGLVVHCYIDGDVIIDEGLVPSDIQSVIMIPITILTGI